MSKFPSLSGRDGVGYETEGKDHFDHTVEFVFNYGNLDVSARKVKAEMADFNQAIYMMQSVTGKAPKSSNQMIDISPVAGEKLGKMIGKEQNMLGPNGKFDQSFSMLADGKRLADMIRPQAQEIGKTGKAIMRQYANRVDTGLMRNSIKYTTRVGEKKTVIRIGWTQLWYKYFGFQENGTRYVSPMHSVLRTFAQMAPHVQKYVSRLMRNYVVSSDKPTGNQEVKF